MSTSQVSCYQCSKLFEPYKTTRGAISKACEACRDRQRKADEKRKDRVRNYQEEAKRNLENNWKDFCRRNIQKRKKEVLLTEEHYKKLVNSSCFFCGYFNENEIIGIDRIDNEKGYTIENCVAACKNCNRIKHIFHPVFFIEKAKIINKYQSGILSDTERNGFYLNWKEYIHKTPVPYIYMKRTTEEKRNIPFNLTKEQYEEIIYRPCYLCGFKNRHGNGLDRINNSIREYSSENVLSCCSTCNMMKSLFEKEVFLSTIKRIAEYYKEIPEEWRLIPRRGFQMGGARSENKKSDEKEKQWRSKTIYKAVKADDILEFKKVIYEQTKWTEKEFEEKTHDLFQKIKSSNFTEIENELKEFVSNIRYIRNGRA